MIFPHSLILEKKASILSPEKVYKRKVFHFHKFPDLLSAW